MVVVELKIIAVKQIFQEHILSTNLTWLKTHAINHAPKFLDALASLVLVIMSDNLLIEN